MPEHLNRGPGGFSRRDLLKGGFGGAVALSASSVLAACGSSSGGGGGGAANSISLSAGPQGGTPTTGGTLRIGLLSAGSSETLDVRKPFNFPDFIRIFQLLDPLFFQGPHGSMSPGLATEAHANSDFTKWTLKLRDGIVWHDGSPFTADDVVFTIQQSWGAKEGLNYNLYKPVIDFNAVRKLDKLTVEIPLHRSVAEFEQLCYTQASHVIKAGTTDWNKPIGTGPFKYESFTPGTESVFAANRDYWQSHKPYVDKLIIDSSFTADPARLNSLLAGEIDIVPSVPPALARAQEASKKVVLGNQHGSAFISLTMRVDADPFKDVRVRQAMKLIPDRATIVSSALDGFGTPGNDAPGNTLQYWASDLTATHDPEKAKSLLKAAGQESLSVKLYTAGVLAGMNETATLFAQQAQAAGVNVSVVKDDPATYYSEGSPGGTWPNKVFSTNNWIIGQGSLPLFYLSAL
ncbi:MAG TPA: ABC transporter substrate-binding protein, partial [Solirubrobacteraceae bacterium]|nr:ABC transporter substrate-binding protein [Solirubrobacteraceae bacterium]